MQTLKKCYQQCDNNTYMIQKSFNIQPVTVLNYKLKFICRDDTSITLQIIDNNELITKNKLMDMNTNESIVINQRTKRFISENNNNNNNTTNESKRIYIIKVQERDDILSQNIVYIVSYYSTQ